MAREPENTAGKVESLGYAGTRQSLILREAVNL